VLGVSEHTLTAWAAAGMRPELGSPLHLLMLAFDDCALGYEQVADAIFRAAAQVHALTPLAACRCDMPTPPTPLRG
jgi:hypothetical protein